MCEGFACTRLSLKLCPRDIKQRIADGLHIPLSVLGSACGTFDFQGMLDTDEPTANLPVLFSSKFYQSPALIRTEDRPYPSGPAYEFWEGLAPSLGVHLFARSDSASFYLNTNKTWVNAGICKSTPNALLFYSTGDNTVRVQTQTSAVQLSAPRLNVSAVQISGDGLSFFLRDNTGWFRHSDPQTWTPVGEQIQGQNLSNLAVSFDGTSLVQSDTRSPLVRFKIQGSVLQTINVPEDVYRLRDLFATVLMTTVFIVRGKSLFSIGSLGELHLILELRAIGTGAWANDKTVWIATEQGTYLSDNVGWTWTFQPKAFAVGPGFYTTDDSNFMSLSSDIPFVEAVGYPLRLTNGGLLYNNVNKWANAYQDKTMNDEFTVIQATDKAVLSPNGLYLLTQEDGVVTLYLNVWNSASFAAWCKVAGNNCQAAYARYCQEFKTDPGCKTDTPGGPINPGPGTPVPPPPPPDPDKGLPTWAIILISIAGLALIAGILYAVLKKPQSRLLSSPLSSPSLSSPSLSRPLSSPLNTLSSSQSSLPTSTTEFE